MCCWKSSKRRFAGIAGQALIAAVLISVGVSAKAGGAQPPIPGGAARLVLLDAVRASLGSESRFRVSRLGVLGDWAYFEGNEMLPLAADEWRDTGLSVKALLTRIGGVWRTVLIWTLPTDGNLSLQRFEQRLLLLKRQKNIPGDIFP